MSKSFEITRRTALRGLGTALALPFLEGMLPSVGLAAPAGAAVGPMRLAFFYVPNGVHMQDWTPTSEGTDYALPHILEPLAGLKGEFSVLTGLTQSKANANGDGPGDHARALASFLTGRTSGWGSRPTKSPPIRWVVTPAFPHWNLAVMPGLNPAIATPATAVPTLRTSPGNQPLSHW